MVAGHVERRPMGALGRMGIVAAAHAALILLVGRGLGIVPPLLPAEPLKLVQLEQPLVPPEDPPRVVVPTFERPVITVPVPEDRQYERDPPPDVIRAQPQVPGDIVVDDGAGSASIPNMVGVRQDARHPLTQPRYPQADIREGNEGNADVEVYVLPNGRVADARIARSSGFDRLDQSAIEEAKRNWRLLPATRAGVPIAQWYKIRVTFKLDNAR